MNVVKCSTLKMFWEKHPDCAEALKTWCKLLRKLNFSNFYELKEYFGTVDNIGNNRVVFNIKGNHYRLITKINYKKGRIFIRFIGTHKEYDKINALTV